MNLLLNEIKDNYSSAIYKRGLEYALAGKVGCHSTQKFRYYQEGEYILAETKVRGESVYQVQFLLEEESITHTSLQSATCTCPYFQAVEGRHECKHIVAAVLEFLRQDRELTLEEKPSRRSKQTKNTKTFLKQKGEQLKKAAESQQKESDLLVKKLLVQYTKHSFLVSDLPPVELKPRFFDLSSDFPHISFSIGREKKYVVKHVDHFLTLLQEEKEHSYGKDLSLLHHSSQFDPRSQKLIQIIANQNNQNDSYYGYHYQASSHLSHNRRCVQMDGNSFRLFFALFLGQWVDIDNWEHKQVLLERADPEIQCQIKKESHGASISIGSKTSLAFYGDESQLYVLQDGKFLQCSQQFTEEMVPLQSFFHRSVFVSQKDLPSVCAFLFSKIQDVVTIKDEEGICQKFLPDECSACFYLDSEDSYGITLSLKFLYGEMELDQYSEDSLLQSIHQNIEEEQKAKNLVELFFRYDKNLKTYVLELEEEVFLTEKLDILRDYGVVYLSNSLQSTFIQTKIKPSLGVSVSNGLLTLDMDTGEFPPEELEALYHSFLKKKKYHKLKDGRLLFMEDSGYEKLAELSHMLQLSPKELKQSKVTLPAYRGLYLDTVLEKSEQIDFRRNKEFRHMMKDFKSVEDSDFQVEETLQASLRPYQVLGFQWLKTLEQYGFGGILADEMGLGKTVQMISFFLSVPRSRCGSANLIVCPASLILNWKEEVTRFAPSLKLLTIMGTASLRAEQMHSEEAQEADIWLTSYDLIKRDREHYQEKEFYCCVLDEAQHIKNQSTLISKTMKSIQCQQRFVLTGTPIENRLSELWNLFDFLMPGYLFSHNAFVSKLEKPIVQSGEAVASKQLSLLVQPFIMRRLKKDVLKELPDKMEYVRKINLSEEERKVYAAATLEVKAKALEGQSKLQILALLTRLRQICCDPHLSFENYTGESSKLDACIELCETMVENGHKILLFSQFTSMLDRIRQRLNEVKLSHLTIEGATSKEKRAKYVKDFQNGQADVFLISLKAGGTGLNLTNADIVIHYDPWWNQAAQNQATDRAHRMGQKQQVQVYKLIAQGTIEEKILELQEKKAFLMDAVLQESSGEPLSQDDILALLE